MLKDLDFLSSPLLTIEYSVLPPPTSTYKYVLSKSNFSIGFPIAMTLASLSPSINLIFIPVKSKICLITSFEFLESLSAEVAYIL